MFTLEDHDLLGTCIGQFAFEACICHSMIPMIPMIPMISMLRGANMASLLSPVIIGYRRTCIQHTYSRRSIDITSHPYGLFCPGSDRTCVNGAKVQWSSCPITTRVHVADSHDDLPCRQSIELVTFFFISLTCWNQFFSDN